MPTVRPVTYIVEPTGYDDFPNLDKEDWCLYVTFDGDRGWSVHRGTPTSEHVLTPEGTWRLNIRRFWRYPLHQALALAARHVDTLPLRGLTAAEAAGTPPAPEQATQTPA